MLKALYIEYDSIVDFLVREFDTGKSCLTLYYDLPISFAVQARGDIKPYGNLDYVEVIYCKTNYKVNKDVAYIVHVDCKSGVFYFLSREAYTKLRFETKCRHLARMHITRAAAVYYDANEREDFAQFANKMQVAEKEIPSDVALVKNGELGVDFIPFDGDMCSLDAAACERAE